MLVPTDSWSWANAKQECDTPQHDFPLSFWEMPGGYCGEYQTYFPPPEIEAFPPLSSSHASSPREWDNNYSESSLSQTSSPPPHLFSSPSQLSLYNEVDQDLHDREDKVNPVLAISDGAMASNPNPGAGAPAANSSVPAVANNGGHAPYARDIYRCLSQAPLFQLSLQEIYNWFAANTNRQPADPRNTGWKNSIRHNLSMNDGFVRVSNGPAGNANSGTSVWRLSVRSILAGEVEPTTRYRRGQASTSARRPARPATHMNLPANGPVTGNGIGYATALLLGNPQAVNPVTGATPVNPVAGANPVQPGVGANLTLSNNHTALNNAHNARVSRAAQRQARRAARRAQAAQKLRSPGRQNISSQHSRVGQNITSQPVSNQKVSTENVLTTATVKDENKHVHDLTITPTQPELIADQSKFQEQAENEDSPMLGLSGTVAPYQVMPAPDSYPYYGQANAPVSATNSPGGVSMTHSYSSGSEGFPKHDHTAAWQPPAPETHTPLDTIVYDYYVMPGFPSGIGSTKRISPRSLYSNIDGPNETERMLLDAGPCQPGNHTVLCDGEWCRV